MNGAVIGGVVGGAVLILIVLGCCIWRRKILRSRSGSTKTGKTMKMKKRAPKSWTQRLKRWTGHPTALHGLTPEQDARNENAAADKHKTKVSVMPDGITLDTANKTEKRYATIERECHKQKSSPPPTERQSEKVGDNARFNDESANCPPTVATRPDERKTYVSVKTREPLTNALQENEGSPNYVSVCGESTTPAGDAIPMVTARPDDKQYVSVKKYPANVTVVSAVEPAYVDKDSPAVDADHSKVVRESTTEQPAYVDVAQTVKIDIDDSTGTAQVKTRLPELGSDSSAGHREFIDVNPDRTALEATDSTGVEQPDYIVVHGRTEPLGSDAEQPRYLDVMSGAVKDCNASSETLLRFRAGRHRDSVNENEAGSENVARAGLQTWASRPEKAAVPDEKTTERNCKTYLSVVSGAQINTQASPDCATYVSVVAGK